MALFNYNEEKKQEQRLWEQWLHGYYSNYVQIPLDKRAEFVPFEQFKEMNIEARQTADIDWNDAEEEVNAARNKFRR